MTENQKWEDVFLSMKFNFSEVSIEFPEILNKRCTKEVFHEMMTSHNSDVFIEKVNFLDYPDIN